MNDMSQVELSEAPRRSSSTSKNLASLLFCFLLIVSICLAAFNFYLLAWIWSNLDGQLNLNSNSVSNSNNNNNNNNNNQYGANLLGRLNLFYKLHKNQASDTIRLSRNLISEKAFVARNIVGAQDGVDNNLELASGDYDGNLSTPLTFRSKNEIRFGGGGGGNQSAASLIISAKQNSLTFPNGLIVRRRQRRRQQQANSQPEAPSDEPAIVCSASKSTIADDHYKRGRRRRRLLTDRKLLNGGEQCKLKSAHFKLTSGEQLNFSNKSIQVRRLQVRRLHSPLNKIQLLATSGIKFESKTKQVHLEALDSISLGSRNSIVIIKASSIDLGELIEFKQNSRSRTGRVGAKEKANSSSAYKLCICLALDSALIKGERRHRTRDGHYLNHQLNGADLEKHWQQQQQQEQHLENDNTSSKLGRVFAVRSELNCSKFSVSFCNKNKNK